MTTGNPLYSGTSDIESYKPMLGKGMAVIAQGVTSMANDCVMGSRR
jgi:hypothetical protein